MRRQRRISSRRSPPAAPGSGPRILLRHRGEQVEPIVSSYRTLDIVELPPNGQGLVTLILLNILETFDLAKLAPDGPERLHLALEAARLAYGERNAHLADPDVHAGVGGGADRQELCQKARGSDRPVAAGRPAAFATLRRRYRLCDRGGSRPHGGFHHQLALRHVRLDNRDREHRDHAAQSRRLFRRRSAASECDRPVQAADAHHHSGAGAAPGTLRTCLRGHGWRTSSRWATPMSSPTSSISAWMCRRRSISRGVFFEGETTVVERGITAAAIEGLRQRGHRVAVRPQPLGGGQAIAIDGRRGVLIGGSDPRKDGCALGY